MDRMPKQKSQHVDDPAAVGRRLRAAREAAGLSQRDLSFDGCSAAYISRIEAGTRIPSLQLLREMGRRLGVSEDYLATGSSMTPADVESQALIDAEVALRLADVDVAQRLYSEALERAVTPAERGRALAGLGQLAFRDAAMTTAIALLEDALRLLPEGLSHRASHIDALGRAYGAVGESELAIGLFEGALAEADESGDELEQLRFGVMLANALLDGGAFGRAEEVLGRVIARTQESRDPLIRARIYWSQSRLHGLQNDHQTAARYARQALAIIETTEHSAYSARAHHLLASIELDRGDAEEALRLLRRATELLVDDSNHLIRTRIRLEEARALALLGRSGEAEAIAMEVAGGFSELDPMDAGRCYALVAQLRAEAGDRPRAIELYELAAEFLSKVPNRFLIDAYGRLAELFEAEGRKDEALEVLKRAVQAQTIAGRSLA
jgi:tetratricopeptide (TPR) repeat protein